MDVLKKLFTRARGEINSGCIVIGGREMAGPGQLFLTLAEQACDENRSLIILDAKQDGDSRTELINRLCPHISRSTGYVFSYDADRRETFDTLDLFSACSTSLEKASLLADLLIRHSMNADYRNDVVTYFQYVIEAKSPCRLKDALLTDPRSALAMLSPADPELDMKRIFIDVFRTRAYENVLAAINILAHSPENTLLSGTTQLRTVLKPGNVIVVSDIPPVSGTVTKNGLFQSVLLALMSGIKRYGIKNGVILLRHADLISPDDLEALMNTAQTDNVLFVWMPENITPFIEAGGGAILGRVDYLSVFRSDRVSAEAWASMFGHRERVKITTTNTSPKGILSRLGIGSIVTGGIGIKPSGWRGSRSVTTTKEDRQNVTADQISYLRDGMAWNLYSDGGFSEGRIQKDNHGKH